MKRLIIFLFLAFGFFSRADAQPKTTEVVFATKIYCDHCAECESCAERIETQLLLSKGVKSAKLDVEAQTITVVYRNGKTDEQTLKNEINKAGFDADDQPADQAYVNKLDACCKKK